MSGRARRAKIPPLVVEPPEGRPADWYARGYRQGVMDGAGAAQREVGILQTHVRPIVEQVTELAGLVNLLMEEMGRRWTKAYAPGDRWQAHPMYLIDVELFERQAAAEAGRPTLQQELAAKASETTPAPSKALPGRKAKRPRPAPAQADPGPTLALGDPELPAAPELAPDTEARRAGGRAWRA